MLNRLILAVKTAGLNHKQIHSVLIADEPEQARQSYPLLRIWPGGVTMNSEVGGGVFYRIVIAVTDRHTENPTSQLEAISDCSQMAIDILASLQYIYRSDLVKWSISDSIEYGYDETPDKVAGATVTLQAKVPYNADFCAVPSHDFDFPSVGLFALQVIDEGYSDTIYTSNLIVDGGLA